jgi:hypothetical protein
VDGCEGGAEDVEAEIALVERRDVAHPCFLTGCPLVMKLDGCF